MNNSFAGLLKTAGILVILVACIGQPPNLQEALDLYHDGAINEARRDLVAYVKAKPFNPESEDARQHILLIRRIKQLESIAIAQWERGNTEGARKVVGIISILHPVYVDSAEIFQQIDFSIPPAWASDSELEIQSLQAGETDSTRREIIPFVIRTLNSHERAVIFLSRKWEERKLRPKVEVSGSILYNPAVSQAISEVDSTGIELQQVTDHSSPLVNELDVISLKIEKLVAYLHSDSLEPSISFDYGFQSQKRELLTQILELKSRLISL